jgi:branched-subunit amino acid aminotransferase/4-amino-4-deoxychorismate lyase
VQELVASGELAGVQQRDIHLDEVSTAREMLLLGGDTHLFPVTSLDGRPVGDGQVGDVAKALTAAIDRDAREGVDHHHDVPYEAYTDTG